MMCTVSTVDGRINLMYQRIYLISENNHLGSVNHVLAFLAGSLQLVDNNLIILKSQIVQLSGFLFLYRLLK